MRPSSSSCSNSMAIDGRTSSVGVPRPQRSRSAAALVTRRVMASSMRALDGGLAGLVGAAHDGQPGRQVDVELAVAAEVADLEPADPHSDTSWPASSRRPRRRASRSSRRLVGSVDPAASSSAMRASRSRMKAPGDRVGRRQGPSVRAGMRRVADADLQERRARARPRSRRCRGRARPAGRRRAGRRARGPGRRACASVSMSAGWVATVAASSWTASKRRPADLALLDLDRAPAGDLVELDEQDLAGAVLVERDGLRGAGVGVRDAARPCPAGRSASGRGRGSRGRSRRSRRS